MVLFRAPRLLDTPLPREIEAEKNQEEDTKKKDQIEVRNKADNLIYVAEKSLKDAGDKVAADVKKEVEDKIAALKSILETGTKEDLEAKTKDLSDTLSKIGQAMYQEQQSKPASPTGDSQTKEDKESKDKKKGKDEEVQEGEVVS